MSAENAAIASDYYKRLYSCECAAAVSAHLSDDYVEHQYTACFSKEGLLDYVRGRLEQNTSHHIVVHKVICEGNSVFLLAEEKLDGGISVARAELFRLARGQVAEHWGSHVVDEKNRKNTNGTFDGPQPNRNVDYARRYAERFEALDLRAFDKQELECFYESRTLDYKQHSPKGGDGLEGLVGILRKMKASGQRMIMQPKRVICDGDFVVCHRLYDSFPKHPLVNRINTFDLFRLNAQGKAVEHWDVMEDVPTEDMLAKIF
jgi:predicted SnoaL-like aldol condensation-catalyzing enzyme